MSSFAAIAEAVPHTPRWYGLRDELIRRNLPLAYYLAHRFARHGEPVEDLQQVAVIGLINAIDRFDAKRGVPFASYATPTVMGELKRYLRDRSWALRVPRRLQENALAITRAASELLTHFTRSPTTAELSAHTGLSEDDILEALESQRGYCAVSLDEEPQDRAGSRTATLQTQAALDEVENRSWIAALLRHLTDRERHVVVLRFFAAMTQSEIAVAIGISQMHVSRLLNRALIKLRSNSG